MTLTVASHADLGAVGREAWLRLEEATPGGTVFQSWWWLSAWWPVWGEGRPLVLTAHEDGRLVGAGAFYVAPDGRLGFIGEEHADYGNVLALGDRIDIVDALVGGLIERRSGWSRACLCDVRLDTPLAQVLRARQWLQGGSVPCPRVRFADRPVGELLAKESLRRHERKLAQAGALEFLHLDAAGEIAPYMARFFEQHIERWALTGHPSLFVKPRNREFYSELAATAEPGGSALFTVILAGGLPVAMHFGLRSQDDLLWYKPTFDPRHASSGPGEVLLAELLRRAGREGCGGLDFTRGEEAFKLRFASEVREVASFEAWPDRLSRAIAGLSRRVRSGAASTLDRLGLKQQVGAWSRHGLRAATLWRTDGVGAVLDRARVAWAHPRASTLEVYVSPPAAGPGNADPGATRCGYLRALGELLEQVDPVDPHYEDLLRHAASRYAAGDVLAVARVADRLVAWGWITTLSPLPITELDAQLTFAHGTTLGYDFRVAEDSRNRGYYTALLRAIACDHPGGSLVLYARSDHVASRRGIERAGYAHVGRLAPGPGGPVYVATAGARAPALSIAATRPAADGGR